MSNYNEFYTSDSIVQHSGSFASSALGFNAKIKRRLLRLLGFAFRAIEFGNILIAPVSLDMLIGFAFRAPRIMHA